MKIRSITFFLTLSFLFTFSCAKNPVTGKREFILISEKKEIEMGKQADPEIVGLFGLYEDEKLQNFIDEKGKEMAAISHRSKLNYEFKILDSPVVNAFAVPGGYVYFTRGILAYFNNEAEFAGVLGHEIGHITARHSAKQYSKGVLAQVGLVAGMVISPKFAQFADIAQAGVSVLFLKFGRDHERQSDRLGVEYSTKIGYDAEEMADFFLTLNRLSEQSGETGLPSFLSTHPNPEDRFENVNEQAAKWKKKVKETQFKDNRDEYLRMIDGMVYGVDPKQGFVENNNFYHPVMKFQFPIPQAWTFQNTPQQVQMAHESGNAAMILTASNAESPEAAAKAFLEQNKLQLVESNPVEVNGIQAIAMVADQKQEQQTIRTLTYFLSHQGNVLAFIGISTLKDFNSFLPVFNASMTNFKPLTDPALLNRQPERIRIKVVNENGALAQVLRNLQVPEERLEELAILNGMGLEDEVTKGMKLKVVEK